MGEAAREMLQSHEEQHYFSLHQPNYLARHSSAIFAANFFTPPFPPLFSLKRVAKGEAGKQLLLSFLPLLLPPFLSLPSANLLPDALLVADSPKRPEEN